MTKLILTEKQFDNLRTRLLEFSPKEIETIFSLDNIVSFYVKNNDATYPITIKIIKDQNNPNNPMYNVFYGKVISKDPIQLKNSIIEISQPHQDIRSGKFVVTKHDKNGKMSKYTINDIFKVEVRDKGGKLLDTYFANEQDDTDDKQPIDVNSKVSNFIGTIGEVGKREGINLMLSDETVVPLTFVDKQGDLIHFEINKTNLHLSPKYAELEHVNNLEYTNTIDNVIYDKDSDSISIKLKTFKTVDGNVKSDDFVIEDIVDVEVSDVEPDGHEYDVSNREEIEKIKKAVLNNPALQKFMYEKPSFFQDVWSLIRGKEAEGTGVIPAEKKLRQYFYSTNIVKTLGDLANNFNMSEMALYEVVGSAIEFNDGVRQIRPNEIRKAMVRVNNFDDETITLTDDADNYQIKILKPIKEQEDVFLVKFTKKVHKGEKYVTFYGKGKIKFLKSRGYTPKNKENTNK